MMVEQPNTHLGKETTNIKINIKYTIDINLKGQIIKTFRQKHTRKSL